MIRAVIDTNILVSALIKPDGPSGPILRALRDDLFKIVFSPPLLNELVQVLACPKLRKKYHIDQIAQESLLALLVLRGEVISPTRKIRICRDHRDDIFLEAAAGGKADYLITGDHDLLSLRAYEGIKIVALRDFLTTIRTAK